MTTVRELIEALQALPEEALDAEVLAPGCCGNCAVPVRLPVFEPYTGNIYLEGLAGKHPLPEPVYQASEEELELRAKGLLP